MSKLVNVKCSFKMKADSKEEAITSLVDVVSKEGYLRDKNQFLEDVLKREETLSTYIGHGIGLPHSQSIGVKDSCITIGKFDVPIEWTEEGEKVDLIFLISVTKDNENNLHLKILSKLARLLMHESFRNQIRGADEQTVYNLIKEKIGEED
ncbi:MULTISPECIES: PTS sugar transporter subunit IIA [unclassified Clostridioides]|uniref:PTS sugar transporter subunit IIA n=1 Tax=unclassified Clostridioides TaxID=2635829 RepID=UPI001D0C664C|nr:PTS sugar transporter subunit IIA [Clostridioides sp. ES-S-0001-02]MCC0641138.1 PTS sugar transporter subunit IIA [Clostridioides sp. ES-S-0049-03]MCC0654180.1 PTS sugar transporter subunit IIA [Clostridioides sp. ES-S-0001-03]MCC0657926.1 PTS sugar transporter subunit IIA [Clostridioides sp. ES-S-0123-01]MCC0677183.1 PTS sugar transporter subunit IIA [Clostridioides sp. ES-W-0018-02]MCC0681699.1 PTS sugar transporter subunit IIA [Clostridioides sp. ES-S-0005-03]MCC0695925.1 PTS sugar tran